MNKTLLLLAVPLMALFASCERTIDLDSEEDGRRVCDSLHANRITGNATVVAGGNLSLRIRDQQFDNDFVYINWWGPGNFSDQGHTSIDRSNVNLGSAGWYYVRLQSMNQGCEKVDSILVTVTLPQGTAPCTPAVNTIAYSNMGTSPITSVTKTHNSLGLKVLSANSSSGSVELQFNPWWRDREPVDGIYKVTTDQTQNDPYTDRIHISSIAQSIYFQGNTEGQNIYISHVNGKLQAQFCGISLSGNNGQSWSTSISGTLREQ